MNLRIQSHPSFWRRPNLVKLKLKVAAYWNQAKHVGCLDSSLRWNDEVEIERLIKKPTTIESNPTRHSGAGQNLGKLKLNLVAYWNQAKHVGCLDSSLRWNDEVEIERLIKKPTTIESNPTRHSGAGQNLGKLKLNLVAYWNQAKHVGCLDSSLRWNDEVEIERLIKKLATTAHSRFWL